ncbi:MAG: IclR family transcriptional regulator [Pseudomonadota bacterium]
MLDDDKESGETIPRSIRLLLILEEVARMGVPATPTEINRSVGLPKQTLHRQFAHLEEAGFLQREHDGRSYSPGPRMRSMAYGVISSTRVRAARLAVMSRLAEEIGETCNLALPERDAMIYLDRVETKWPMRIQFPIGTKVPFHCTASGKLYLSSLPKARLERMVNNMTLEKKAKNTITDRGDLLAELGKIRGQGYSEDNEEFVDAMIALAVPINDENGRLVSTLAFHAPTPRMSMEVAHTHLQRLRDAAQELSQLL